jgi:hypothetical protein
VIKKPQKPDTSKTDDPLYRKLVTITSSDGMLSHDDVKCLSETLGGAFDAVLTTAGITGTWTISLEVVVRSELLI